MGAEMVRTAEMPGSRASRSLKFVLNAMKTLSAGVRDAACCTVAVSRGRSETCQPFLFQSLAVHGQETWRLEEALQRRASLSGCTSAATMWMIKGPWKFEPECSHQ
jgi:hypothetical protein